MKWLAPVDQVTVGFYALLLAVLLFEQNALPQPALFCSAAAAGAAASAAVAYFVRGAPLGRALALRTLALVVLVPAGFELVGRMVPFVAPDSHESWLLAADRAIFGGDPTRWTGDHEAAPLLTEILQWIYTSFYFLPLLLAAALAARRNVRALEDAMLIIVLGFFLSYLGYLLVPARSPYHLAAYPFPLRGVFAADGIRALLDRLEGVKYDCFPSGHSEIAMLLAALAWRHDRRAFFAFFGPIGVLLPCSTIYLRYHYGVDVLAAAGFAALTWWVAARVAPFRANDSARERPAAAG